MPAGTGYGRGKKSGLNYGKDRPHGNLREFSDRHDKRKLGLDAASPEEFASIKAAASRTSRKFRDKNPMLAAMENVKRAAKGEKRIGFTRAVLRHKDRRSKNIEDRR